MARAEARTREVEKVVAEIVNDGVTLHLSKDEAETLLAVMRRIGGNPLSSRRRYTEAIANVLEGAEVKHPVIETYDPGFVRPGDSIYFEEEDGI